MSLEQDLCRVTVCGPQARIDLALPADLPFAQLLPAIADHVGAPPEDDWVLQRLDEAPFDEGSTPEQAGLRHGELLYLRPVTAQLPALSHDDVADVIATGVNGLPARWRPEWARIVALTVVAVASAAAAALIVAAGPPWRASAFIAAGIALGFLVAAAVVARVPGDPVAGCVLGLAGLPHTFLAGYLASRGDLRVLIGLGTLTLVGLAAVAGGGVVLPVAAISAAAGVGSVAVGAWLAIPGASAAAVAAVTMAVTLAMTPLIPGAAFRMARIPLPDLPASEADLRRETLTIDSAAVLRQTAPADRFVTGAVLAQAMVCVAAMIPLALSTDPLARISCGVFGCALLLRARVFQGGAQRLALLTAGLAGPLILAGAIARHGSQRVILTEILPVLLAVAAVFVAAGLRPGPRRSPFWGLAAGLADLVVIIALIPLALGVAGVYGRIHGLVG